MIESGQVCLLTYICMWANKSTILPVFPVAHLQQKHTYTTYRVEGNLHYRVGGYHRWLTVNLFLPESRQTWVSSRLEWAASLKSLMSKEGKE